MPRPGLALVLATCLIVFASPELAAGPQTEGELGIPALGLSSSAPIASATMFSGAGSHVVPIALHAGEGNDDSRSVTSEFGTFPYVRYEVTFADAPVDAQLEWRGRSVNLNDLSMHVWDQELRSWGKPVSVAGPATPGGSITLSATLDRPTRVVDVLVIDGPRRDDDFRRANSSPDQRFADPAGYDFALQHITDTQYLSQHGPGVFEAMTQWTANNAEHRKIAYSMHTGDLVQSWLTPGSSESRAREEFDAADEAMAILEKAVVPHGVLPGNHDNLWNAAGRLVPGAHEKNHALYNEYFGPFRYREQPWWGDSVTESDNSAHYDVIEVAGAKFLMLLLGYNPPEHVMSWAEEVLREHPDHNVVIGTHYYLDEFGELRMSGFGAVGSSSGQEIWNRLVVPFESVFLVLSGHVDGQTTVTDRQVGDSDRTVVELQSDYQNFSVDGRRETGFQRLLQFDIDGGSLAVTTHSPALDSFRVEDFDPQHRYTPEDGDFVVDFELRADMPRAVIPAR